MSISFLGINLVTDLINDKDLSEIYVDIKVEGNPIYANDVYRLRFRVPKNYPVEVPWVQFVKSSPKTFDPSKPVSTPATTTSTSKRFGFHRLSFSSSSNSNQTSASTNNDNIQFFPIPIHPHIYSNGHICLDLLGDAWSPIHTILSVSISLQSMLSSNDVKGKSNFRVNNIFLI